ncbi:MAG: aminoglycoside phosphotransferase family protein [Paracoccaceae bacterium]
MPDPEIPLEGGNVNGGVVRIGNTVRRKTSPQSPLVHKLLLHLEAQGFTAAPRFLGHDEVGREILGYIPGRANACPETWEGNAAAIAAVRMLRRYHDATTALVGQRHAGWAISSPDPARHEVICHNDFGPYNMIFDGAVPVAMIDFDLAGPGPRMRDLAYLAYWFAPLCFSRHDLAACSEAELAAGCPRLRLICEEYGHADMPALLDMLAISLLHLSSEASTARVVGAAVAAQLAADGYLKNWHAEYRALIARRAAILACFA